MHANPVDRVITLTMPEHDSPMGVSRTTWRQVSAACGLDEDEAIHLAMAECAARAMQKRKRADDASALDATGMDLAPLGRLMSRHDPNWPQ